MAKAKSSIPTSVSENQELKEAVVELTEHVAGLAEQVEVLRIAIDDLRQEVEWAIRNITRPAWVPTQTITSLPKDPLAPDFAERVNRYSAKDLPEDPPLLRKNRAEKPAATRELFGEQS